jgi:pimeloyl-ACP methyl ester carboxylesterase
MTNSAKFDTWLDGFTTELVEVDGIATAVYSDVKSSKPIVLFVHGLNGDYHGLVPLAFELRNEYRVMFADLPGHGGTAIPHGDNLMGIIKDWGEQLVGVLRSQGFDVTAVVGHSFGTLSVQYADAAKIILINPPFETSSLSRGGSAILSRTGPLVNKVFSSYPVMVRRGQWLMHKRTDEADAIISWSSNLTHVSDEQFVFQTRLSIALSGEGLMDSARLAAIPKLLVVLADFDNIVNNDAMPTEALANATVLRVPTGHVSVFEMPVEIAEVIREYLG